MFGRHRPVAFDPYRGRRRRRVPSWLLLVLAGIAVGAGGVVWVQENYLPPRLSPSESAELRAGFDRAEAERTRLATQLAHAARELETTLADKRALEEELAAGRETVEQLRTDVRALVAALPPDPRGGPIAVRAARFEVEGGQLAYDVVLSQDSTGAKPFSGVMQLVLAGPSGRADDIVKLEPVEITVGAYESVRGSQPLPDGFKPRQTTVQVLDRVDGKRYGMRIVNVR